MAIPPQEKNKDSAPRENQQPNHPTVGWIFNGTRRGRGFRFGRAHPRLVRVGGVQFRPVVAQAVLSQEEGGHRPGIVLGQTAGFPKRHGGLDVGLQNRRVGKFLQGIRAHQRGNAGGQFESVIVGALAVATRVPAVTVFGRVGLAKFFSQALAAVAVTGFADQPVYFRTYSS